MFPGFAQKCAEPDKTGPVIVYRASEPVVAAVSSGFSLWPSVKNATAMFDPVHLRARAQLCFAIADLMSDPADAERVRLAAQQYAARAERVERDWSDEEGARPLRKASG